jgi:intergrase/recombinase
LRPNVLKSLSALAKYTGCYQGFKDAMKQFGLTWGGRSSDDIVIDRITKVQNPDEVFSWIKQVKSKRPDLQEFMDFITVTGLRLDEAFQSYNLIVALTRKGKLEEYYNEKTQTLEHYKFKETFIRKSKKAFISFVPRELIQRIQENEPFKSKGGIQKRVVTSGLKLRFSDIREAHASFMTKHLKQPEIDFVHGRVASNVFMRNYFNPALIGDLEARAMQGIREIQEKVRA